MVNSKLMKFFFLILILTSINIIVEQIIVSNYSTLIVNNTGISLGLFAGYNASAIIIATIINIFLLFLIIKNIKEDINDNIFLISLTLIISGGLSNLYERIVYGYVIDYIHFWIIPTFNTSDAMITTGVIILAYKIIRS